MKRKEVLQKSAEKALQTIIKNNGGEDNAEVFDNLKFLCTKIEKWGITSYYIPLRIKKLLCTMLDSEYRIEYKVAKTDEFCEVEALFFWSDYEIPTGRGYVRKHISQISPMDSLTNEERLSLMESTCRGAAATRAISDAGVAAEYYGDVEDLLLAQKEQEAIEESLEKVVDEKVPTTTSKNDKTAERRAKANAKAEVPSSTSPTDVEEPQTVEEPITEEASEESKDDLEVSKNIESAVEEPIVEASASQDEKKFESEISLEDAFNAIADVGTLAGNTLGDIYKKANNKKMIIYIANRSETVSEHAKVIIYSDKELTEKYERHTR